MTETKPSPAKVQESRKGLLTGMIIIAVFLTAVAVFLAVMYFDKSRKMDAMEASLTHEKDSLANELRKMFYAYDTLKTDNDNLKAEFEVQKQRIVRLLSEQASNFQLIKKYRAEITTMREIMKSYIVQIDSLNTRNKMLTAENIQIKQQITDVQTQNVVLEKVKEELNAMVVVASVIQAKNISAAAVNRKNKETSRLNLMEKLRVGFTLRENPIATAGPKTIYLRVMRPDSLVITTSPDNLFDFRGNRIIYSATRTIDYMNQDLDVTIWLDNTGDFVPGNYSAVIYLDDAIIGKTTFMLTKR